MFHMCHIATLNLAADENCKAISQKLTVQSYSNATFFLNNKLFFKNSLHGLEF